MGFAMPDKVKEWLSGQGYAVGKSLGSGAFGTAYSLGNGLVIKTTQQKEDFDATAQLLGAKFRGLSAPCLPIPERVIVFEGGREKSYGLIRPDLRDATWPNYLSARFVSMVNSKNTERTYPEYSAQVLKDYPEYYGAWLAIVETAYFCEAYDFRMDDCHQKNWGEDANGIPVFRDIGNSYFGSKATKVFEKVDLKSGNIEVMEAVA